jgi:hypothetical protein
LIRASNGALPQSEASPKFVGWPDKPGHDEDSHTSASKENPMIYELRVYHTMPGKLPALLNRFDTITLKIWERHGIHQAGFWTTLVGESNADLTYMLKWESLAEREKKWDAFQADPEWIAKRAETEKDGPINARVENSFLVPTSFSSVK